VRSAAEGPAYLWMQHFSVSQQAGDPHAGHSTYFTTGSTHRFGVARCFNMGWGVRFLRATVARGRVARDVTQVVFARNENCGGCGFGWAEGEVCAREDDRMKQSSFEP
jgi:hypothetical protein